MDENKADWGYVGEIEYGINRQLCPDEEPISPRHNSSRTKETQNCQQQLSVDCVACGLRDPFD